jgi:DNA-binding transcriptional LysR family regulator
MLEVTRLRVIDAVARHGSVTAAAQELNHSQPSVSHHLARLEAETGAKPLQRAGRGIRLTRPGQLLADRAAEIVGRIEAADAELSALTAGRVRQAGFSSAIGSLAPRAVATLASRRPGLQVSLTDTHSPDAIELLRAGKIDVALIFWYDQTEPEPDGFHLQHLLDDRYICCRDSPDARWPGCTTPPGSPAAPVPPPPPVAMRGRGERAQDRLHVRHGRDADTGSRRSRGHDHPRVGDASPPRRGHRHRRAAGLAPARLRADLR